MVKYVLMQILTVVLGGIYEWIVLTDYGEKLEIAGRSLIFCKGERI